MRRCKVVSGVVLAALFIAALGAVSSAQEATGATGDAGPAELAASAFSVEHAAQVDAVAHALQSVSTLFESIREYARGALVAPIPQVRSMMVQTIFDELQGVDTSGWTGTYEVHDYNGYLLGDGGHLETFAEALHAYEALIEPYHEILAAHLRALCPEEYGDEYCPEGPEEYEYRVDNMLDRLDRLMERVALLAEAALDAALRIDMRPGAPDPTQDFITIYACAVTAASYEPMVALSGQTTTRRYTEERPSMLYDFLTQFEALDQYVVDAVAEAS